MSSRRYLSASACVGKHRPTCVSAHASSEDGKLILWTKRSKGAGKLDGQIPHFIRQQMKLDEEQFARLIDCPLKRPEYVEILKEKGLIPRS
jgi:hypothetical protein